MKSMMEDFHNQVYDRVDTKLVMKFYREFFVIPLFEYTRINYD
jgi:hypothetical protein